MKSFGFSTKSVIILFESVLTTPKAEGSSILLTQIIPSLLLSNLKSALNKVSSN